MVNNERINNYLLEARKTIEALDIDMINQVFNVLDGALKNGKTVYVFGNGGSGSTATHMTNDFNKAIFRDTSMTFNFRCLNDNIPLLLAISNDIGYDDVFVYQLNGRLTCDDIVIALSGSGNSMNVINAVEYARYCGAMVIAFTGYDGGKLKGLADYSLDTNICNMQITEDIHLMMEHLLISLFYDIYGVGEYKKLVLKKNRE